MEENNLWEGTRPPKYSKAYDQAVKLCQLERHTEALFIPIISKKARNNLKQIAEKEQLTPPQRPEYGMFLFVEKLLSLPPERLYSLFEDTEVENP